MASTTDLVVPTGPYLGFTLVQLETELTSYQAQRRALSSALAAASINGQSFQFQTLTAQKAALAETGADLELAFAYLDPGRFPVNPGTNTSAAVLR